MSNDLDRLGSLLANLGAEILTARSGSQEGQFPILDLMDNVRDELRKIPGSERRVADACLGWERMLLIVESGQPFTAADIDWLKELLPRLQAAGVPGSPAREGTCEGPARAAAADSSTAEKPEDNEPLVLNLPADAELLHEFCAESREHLDNIEQGVLVLESKPDDTETLNTVFRAFHTFKGSAGFLNLVPINRLAHVLESLLDLARRHKIEIDRDTIELILQGRDTLRMFLDQIEAQASGAAPLGPVSIPTAGLKAAVGAVIQAASDGVSAVATRPAEAAPPGAEPAAAPSQPLPPNVASSAGSPIPMAADGSPPAAARPEHNAFVKVDTGKLDALLDLVGEMVISQSLVASNLNGLSQQNPQFAGNMAQLARITKDLQRVSMSMRMVPIRASFQKMVRVVRDIGAKQGKKVRLLTHGEDTELDRGVVEQLTDPLLHLVRNSVDHGIESEAVRLGKGKAATGTIQLRATHQGGNIVIEVSDDGAGLDRERILAKATERGLVRPGYHPSDEEVFEFIFAPGFSTADKITDISGRGVGLDVVRRNLENLRGRVDISSSVGSGTLFRLSLPLTLAIIDGLVVGVGEEQYIVPTLSVLESIRLNPGMITCIAGRGEVVNVRGRLIPLLRLYERFCIKPASMNVENCIGVVIQAGTTLKCLLVDTLVSKQEVVIKNLNDLMAHKNRFLAGATILGDGRVGLILDINAIVQAESHAYAKAG